MYKSYSFFKNMGLSDYYSIEKNDIAALWSCSGRPGASRVGVRCRFAAEPLHG